MTVRLAIPADAPLVQRVAAETFPDACPPGTPPADIREFIERNLDEASITRYLHDDARRILLLESSSGEILGYAMLVRGDPVDPDVASVVTTRPTVELNKLYLREAARGTGAADDLMAAAVAEAAASGAGSLWLGCSSVNDRANRFYERLGFVLVGTRSFRLGSRLERDVVRERVPARVTPRRP
jgi:GNAT superfamily N-acetyltransferase